MKKCPYCAEDIREEAIKCRHCGEFLNKKETAKWYFRPMWIFIIFLCIGPLVLPLIIINPNFNRKRKILLSILIILASYVLWIWFSKSLSSIAEYYKQMNELF